MEFLIDLQLFSDEKTEKPTPKKIQKSREEGQVLQSREVNSALMLMGAFAAISVASAFIGKQMLQLTHYVYTEYLSTDYAFTVKNLYNLMLTNLYHFFLLLLPVAGVCFVIGLIASYMQVGFLFTTKPLMPKLSRLNPLEGFKRMFSFRSIVELVKSFIKIFFVGYVVWGYAEDQIATILSTIEMNTETIVSAILELTLGIGYRAGAVLIVLAAADYMYQWFSHMKQLKMSKQEIKEEYKQMEGNPQIKSKIKQKQREISMRRMMQDVPKADVIITNPTHFAVAIKYDPHLGQAPRVLAKGQDLVAQQIKKLASENNVPIVENKQLARTLYAMVEIGDLIPPELYQAVAEVLAYVYQMNKKKS